MLSSQLSILQRLPEFYRWQAGSIGLKVEPWHSLALIDSDELDSDEHNKLIGLKFMQDSSDSGWELMTSLSEQLSAIYVENAVVKLDEMPCLFIRYQDQSATFCCLRNLGIAIAEPFLAE